MRKQAESGYICSYINNSHLFQYDLVTQRVKEQKVAFVGIVMHVKQFVSVMDYFLVFNCLFNVG